MSKTSQTGKPSGVDQIVGVTSPLVSEAVLENQMPYEEPRKGEWISLEPIGGPRRDQDKRSRKEIA